MANVCFAHIKYDFFSWDGNFCGFLSCGREKKIKLKVILAGSDELWGRFTLVLLRDENNGARRGRLFLLSNNAFSKVSPGIQTASETFMEKQCSI